MEIVWGSVIFLVSLLVSHAITYGMEQYYRGAFDHVDKIVEDTIVRSKHYMSIYREEDWGNLEKREQIVMKILLQEQGIRLEKEDIEAYLAVFEEKPKEIEEKEKKGLT